MCLILKDLVISPTEILQVYIPNDMKQDFQWPKANNTKYLYVCFNREIAMMTILHDEKSMR